jgi:hypothetical protein
MFFKTDEIKLDARKVLKTILSCKTVNHCEVTRAMVDAFERKHTKQSCSMVTTMRIYREARELIYFLDEREDQIMYKTEE